MKTLSILALTAAIAALAGCVTSPDYGYRGGSGDYYYGQPSVVYNRYGSPYGYSRYGSHYGYGSYGSLRYRQNYGYPRYGYPYYPYYPYYPQRPGSGHDDDDHDDREGYHYAKPVWRNLDEVGRRQALENAGNREIRIAPGYPGSRQPIRVQPPSNVGARQATPRQATPVRPSRNNAVRTQRIQRVQRMQGQLSNKRNRIEP